jgi:hypothetical protein
LVCSYNLLPGNTIIERREAVNGKFYVIFFTIGLDFALLSGDLSMRTKLSVFLSWITAYRLQDCPLQETPLSDIAKFTTPEFSSQVIVIVGGFGSGKSEVCVNLAAHLAKSSDQGVTIADLDVINPYFRSREAARELESLGVKSLIPAGENVHADLPIVIPEIKGAIEEPEGTVILDVGGDDLGARVLSSLRDAFPTDGYDLLLVHNANRPFTADVKGTQKVIGEIAGASRLDFTGIICNTHLMGNTTPEVVLAGLKVSREVSAATELPIVFLSALIEVLRKMDPKSINCPVLPINRSLLKPWERKAPAGGN